MKLRYVHNNPKGGNQYQEEFVLHFSGGFSLRKELAVLRRTFLLE